MCTLKYFYTALFSKYLDYLISNFKLLIHYLYYGSTIIVINSG